MKITSAVASLSLALLIGVVALADDGLKPAKKGQGKAQGKQSPVVRRLMMPFKDVTMQEEQKTQVMAKAKESAAKIEEISEAHGITAEVMKARAEATKSMKDSELKGKERQAAVNEKAGLTAQQTEGMEEVMTATQSFQKEVFAMLTDDQKASVPERLAKQLGAKGKGGGKKGKKNND